MKKRILSIIFALLVIVSAITTPAAAVTNGEDAVKGNTLSHEEVLEIAISTFPEYREKLRGEHHNTPEGQLLLASTEDPVIVFQETRMINEFDSVTYQEYSNGAVFATTALSGKKTETSNNEYGGFTYVTLNMYTYCTYAQDMILVEGVEVFYRAGAYGQITGTGTPVFQTGYAYAYQTLYTKTGTDSAPAYLEYTGALSISDSWEQPGIVLKDVYLLLTLTASGYSVSAGWA